MQHYDNFAESMEKLYYSNSNEKTILTSLIHQILDKKTFNHGLDIGAGQGLITQPLADRCQQLTLIEPLIEHANLLKKKFIHSNVYPGLFQNFQTDALFDIILCAHMLYYLQPAELIPTLLRMVKLLTKNGMLLLINGEVDFIFSIFSSQLSQQFKVTLPKTKEIVHILSPFGKCEIITSPYDKVFFNEQEMLSYLAQYLTVTEADVLSCPAELAQFKNLLKWDESKITLTHTNSLICFKKG